LRWARTAWNARNCATDHSTNPIANQIQVRSPSTGLIATRYRPTAIATPPKTSQGHCDAT
jgi:hypothetical protein